MSNADIVVEEIPDAEVDPNHPVTVAVEAFRARSVRAKRNAQALRRTAEQWPLVRDDEDWERVVDQAAEDYATGAFLLKQLGGQAALDPSETATLLNLRQSIIEQMGITTAHESMILDLALLGYSNALRAQSWLGNLAYLLEADCFGLESPKVRYTRDGRFADGFTAGDHLQRMRDQLLPLIDRANRMFIRNLAAIREMRRGPATTIAVGQVNVGDKQINISR